MVSMASSSSSFLHNGLRLNTVCNFCRIHKLQYLSTYLQLLFSNNVLFMVSQISKTWVINWGVKVGGAVVRRPHGSH